MTGAIDKRKLARLIESGSTVISSISKDLKSAAQQRELHIFIDGAKKRLSAGKSVVLVAATGDPIAYE